MQRSKNIFGWTCDKKMENGAQIKMNEPIIQRKCVKCGRILAQSNRKNKCEVCRGGLKQTVLRLDENNNFVHEEEELK